MRRLVSTAVVAALALVGRTAAAEPEDLGPGSTEAGLFLGGFISNYFHQFYDDTIKNRQELNQLSPELGGRFAVFPSHYVGFEGEGSIVLTSTKTTGDSAQLYQLRAQVLLQVPGRFTPFIGLGIGMAHISSDMNVLGSDTDFPIHAGIGARFFATRSVAIRADLRLLRGPSQQAPYTLNASYGEFSVGVSFIPNATTPVPPPPPPDPDPDHDGVIGMNDLCPLEPGNGNPDGCPTRDKDNDGIPDNVDKCPTEPETINGWEDTDGCPDTIPDTDGDGLNDLVDKCKDQAEDKDGFQDEDGCPDPDNDNDGVLDTADKCPMVAGPVENFGCPDTDSDGDGVVDRLDNCPTEKGTEANHGCMKKQLVVITKNQLQILDQVQFQTGTAKLSPKSKPLLDNIARVLTAHPEIKKIKVEGHTDNVGNADKNQKLSEDRAASVAAYLVKAGIATERLVPAGHGDTMPLEDNTSAKGRQTNRRVEFNIVNE